MLNILLALLMFGQNATPKNMDSNAWVATYSTGDVKFVLPPQLTLFDALKGGRIINFTSFDGQYYHGGVIPEGGLEVVIRFKEKEDWESVEKLIDEETRFSNGVSKYKINLNGQSATKIVYGNDYGGLQEINTTVYFERSNKIYKFSMVIRKEDSEKKELTDIFEKLLQSVRFEK